MHRLTVAALALASSFAVAADLKPFQEEAKARFDKQAADLLKDVNAACGTSFSNIATDFEHFDKADFNRNPPGAVCSTMTYAVKQACASPAYKKAFVAKVKGLACVMGGNQTDPKDFKARFFVKDGVWTFKMDRDGSGGIQAAELLKAALDT